LFACQDVIEMDISKRTVKLLSPAANIHTTTYTNTFWWEQTEGALEYQLQIAKPSFASIQQFILDTTIENNQFVYTLATGTYEWRIRALNGSSQTNYVSRILYVDSTSSLSGQTLVLASPVNNYITNITTNTFKWDALTGADDYRFQVGTTVDVVITADSFTYTLGEGIYTWQVRGQNTSSNTLYSSRSITIDLTAPGSPTLISPLNGATQAITDTLVWNRDATAIGDSLYIYPDSLISAPVYNGYTTGTTYIFTGTSTQDYFWRVKSKDTAGNWSGFSVLRKFWVQ